VITRVLPGVAVVAVALALGERLSPAHFAGTALILLGLVFVRAR
jgi:drug/metabolite transporter (DMT)-like permease